MRTKSEYRQSQASFKSGSAISTNHQRRRSCCFEGKKDRKRGSIPLSASSKDKHVGGGGEKKGDARSFCNIAYPSRIFTHSNTSSTKNGTHCIGRDSHLDSCARWSPQVWYSEPTFRAVLFSALWQDLQCSP